MHRPLLRVLLDQGLLVDHDHLYDVLDDQDLVQDDLLGQDLVQELVLSSQFFNDDDDDELLGVGRDFSAFLNTAGTPDHGIYAF